VPAADGGSTTDGAQEASCHDADNTVGSESAGEQAAGQDSEPVEIDLELSAEEPVLARSVDVDEDVDVDGEVDGTEEVVDATGDIETPLSASPDNVRPDTLAESTVKGATEPASEEVVEDAVDGPQTPSESEPSTEIRNDDTAPIADESPAPDSEPEGEVGLAAGLSEDEAAESPLEATPEASTELVVVSQPGSDDGQTLDLAEPQEPAAAIDPDEPGLIEVHSTREPDAESSSGQRRSDKGRGEEAENEPDNAVAVPSRVTDGPQDDSGSMNWGSDGEPDLGTAESASAPISPQPKPPRGKTGSPGEGDKSNQSEVIGTPPRASDNQDSDSDAVGFVDSDAKPDESDDHGPNSGIDTAGPSGESLPADDKKPFADAQSGADALSREPVSDEPAASRGSGLDGEAGSAPGIGTDGDSDRAFRETRGKENADPEKDGHADERGVDSDSVIEVELDAEDEGPPRTIDDLGKADNDHSVSVSFGSSEEPA
jgi:hypothetical protein